MLTLLCTLPLSETRPFSFHLYLLYHVFSPGNDKYSPLLSHVGLPSLLKFYHQLINTHAFDVSPSTPNAYFSTIILSLEEIILPDISRKDEFFPAFIKRKKKLYI